MKAKFKKFSTRARVPEKATSGFACFNGFCARSVTLEPEVTSIIETNIGLKFSKNYVCRLYLHSGLSSKSVILGRGVFDSNFRGSICVILENFSKWVIEIETGDRIA